jgi:glycerate-2-kinase
VRADRLLAQALPRVAPDVVASDRPYWLVAVGKAAAPMAAAWLRASRGPCRDGVVVSPDGAPVGDARIAAIRGGHPVPTAGSLEAGQRAIASASALGRDDRLVVLLSGGASALAAVPAAGLTLDDKVAATDLLMRAGAAIGELNAVRKHLSRLKGGQLAATTRAETWTFALSDVVAPVEDDASVIGSGPTVADPTTFGHALDVLERYHVMKGVPRAVRARLEAGAVGTLDDTPKPGDACLAHSEWRLIGSRRDAMRAAAAIASELGYATTIIEAPLIGEARDAGPALVALARARSMGQPRPLCVIASGETTVRVTGTGAGGRNQELALSVVALLAGIGEPIVLASVGTDGRDGPTDAAGAFADASTLDRARRAGLGSPGPWLAENNAYPFFDALGDLVRTGPTGTNVADLQVILIA